MRHPMHFLTIPSRNRVLRFLRRPEESDFLCRRERELQCVFFHIPKTGGLAICDALLGGYHVNHRLFRKCERQDPVALSRFWKFCILRDPETRFLSAYRFLKAGGLTDMDRRFRETHAEAFTDLGSFVEAFRNRDDIRRFVHFRPQTDFICDAKGRFRMDFAGRFEALSESFGLICKRLGVESTLRHVNTTPEAAGRSGLTGRDSEFLRVFYAADYAVLHHLPSP